MLTAEQKTLRATGLGASEIATIMGLNPYQTPYQLWRLKTGLDPVFEGNKYTLAGHMLEDAVARYFAIETNAIITEGVSKTFQYPLIDILFATPDRLFVGVDNKEGVLECKSTQKSISKDDIPLMWFVQLQFQMGVTGIHQGALAWLSRGIDFGYEFFEFDQSFFTQLCETAVTWWESYVVPNVEPPITNSSDIEIMYPFCEGKILQGTEDIQKTHAEIIALDAQIKELESKCDMLKEQVKMVMLDSDRIEYAGNTLFTWKTSKASVRIDNAKLQSQFPDAYNAVKFEAKASRPFLTKK
jgi:putative phage-type endonuclease